MHHWRKPDQTSPQEEHQAWKLIMWPCSTLALEPCSCLASFSVWVKYFFISRKMLIKPPKFVFSIFFSLPRWVYGVCWPTWPLTRTRGTNKSKTIRLWCRLDITFSLINSGETFHFHFCRGSPQYLAEEDFSISFVPFFPFPPPIWSLATGLCQSDKRKEIKNKHDVYVWMPSLSCTFLLFRMLVGPNCLREVRHKPF